MKNALRPIRVHASSFIVCGALLIFQFTQAFATDQSDGGDLVAGEGFEQKDAFRDELLSGGYGPEMVVIPTGSFRMGCVSDCMPGWDPNAEVSRVVNQPTYVVTFQEPFALSKYETTIEEFDRFLKAEKAEITSSETAQRKRHPKNSVSWPDAVAYVQWLSEETGAPYRLPSEAEWEYAARAGATTKYHFRDDASQFCRYGNHLDGSVAPSDLPWSDSAWLFGQRNAACRDGVGKGTAEVGRYLPNGFGLYDMHGNVAEWTRDCWNTSYHGAPTDGRAFESGDCSHRIIRGGAWMNPMTSAHARVANRVRSHVDGVGFRVAQTLRGIR